MIIPNMQATLRKPWLPRLAAFVLALLLASSVAFWVLRWPAQDRTSAPPLPVVLEAPVAVDATALERLLGGAASPVAAAAPDAAGRFRLTGIIASGAGKGVALLSIDGKPPKPYRVGSQLEDGLMLQSVEKRRVALAADASAPVRFQLELPAPPP